MACTTFEEGSNMFSSSKELANTPMKLCTSCRKQCNAAFIGRHGGYCPSCYDYINDPMNILELVLCLI